MLNFCKFVGLSLMLLGLALAQTAACAAQEYPLTASKADYDSALRNSAALLAKNPKDAHALAVNAWALRGLAKPEEAIKLCHQA
ncbi:MAG TPA: hypothetical protein V6C72_07860, partial [Chroococcales cyanobacterium]